MRTFSCISIVAGGLLVAQVAEPAHAVLVYQAGATPTATRTVVTSSAGTYDGAAIGDWVAQDGLFSAVAIGPYAFLTAGHFATGATLTLGGQTYTKSGDITDPNMSGSDLRIITVNELIPQANIAPIYTGSSETGLNSAIFGRGVPSGSAITTGTTFNGWQVLSDSSLDGDLSEALDKVGFTYDATSANHYIGWNFTATQGSTSLTSGDSGGAVFVLNGGKWQLAGINYGISSPFYTDASGDGQFEGTIVNGSGLYFKDSSNHFDAASGPGDSLATRVSSEATWVSQYVPEPTSLSLIAVGGLFTLRRRSR